MEKEGDDEEVMEEKEKSMGDDEMMDKKMDEEGAEEMKKIPEGPVEYKVLLLTSDTQLDKDHDLYLRHSKLDEKKKGDQYYYLIGSFDEVGNVEKYFNTAVKLAYPEAQIVMLIDGEIQ